MFVTNTALMVPLCNRCHTGTIGEPRAARHAGTRTRENWPTRKRRKSSSSKDRGTMTTTQTLSHCRLRVAIGVILVATLVTVGLTSFGFAGDKKAQKSPPPPPIDTSKLVWPPPPMSLGSVGRRRHTVSLLEW